MDHFFALPRRQQSKRNWCGSVTYWSPMLCRGPACRVAVERSRSQRSHYNYRDHQHSEIWLYHCCDTLGSSARMGYIGWHIHPIQLFEWCECRTSLCVQSQPRRQYPNEVIDRLESWRLQSNANMLGWTVRILESAKSPKSCGSVEMPRCSLNGL